MPTILLTRHSSKFDMNRKKTYHIDISDDEAIKRFLFGLVMECPLGGNPEGCQFHQIRCVKGAERRKWQWLKQLSHDELLDYYLNHHACITNKKQ